MNKIRKACAQLSTYLETDELHRDKYMLLENKPSNVFH